MKRNILKIGILAVALSASVNAATVDFAAYAPAAMKLVEKYSADFKAGVSLEAMMKDAMETVPGQLIGIDLRTLMTQNVAQIQTHVGMIEANLPKAIAGIKKALDSNQLGVIGSSISLIMGMLKDWGVLPSQLDAFASQLVSTVDENSGLINNIGAAVHGLLSQVRGALVNLKDGLGSKVTLNEKAVLLKTFGLPYLFTEYTDREGNLQTGIVPKYFNESLRQFVTADNAQKLVPLINILKGIDWGSINFDAIKTAIEAKLAKLSLQI